MATTRNVFARLGNYRTLIALIIPLVVFAAVIDLFAGPILERVTIVLFINLMMVVGLQMFMGNAGVASFTHIGFMGIGAYVSIILTMSPEKKAVAMRHLYEGLAPLHLPFIPALLVAALVATLLAAIVGFPLMRLSGAASVISTFALLVIIHVIMINWEQVTNGTRTVFGIPTLTTLWITVAFAIASVGVAWWFKETSIGLKLRASREDERAAASIGINIVQVRWVAFVASVFVTALAGGLWAHFILTFSPISFYLAQTFLIIAMLIIGGTGSVSGAVVGTVVVTFLLEGLRGIENTINLSGIFDETIAGIAVLSLSISMILLLIFRSEGITKGEELRLPGRRARAAASIEAAEQEA